MEKKIICFGTEICTIQKKQGKILHDLKSKFINDFKSKKIIWTQTYHYHFIYLYFRFERVPDLLLEEPDGVQCRCCGHIQTNFENEIPRLDDDRNSFWFQGEKYNIGDGVMVVPETFSLNLRNGFKGFRKNKKDKDRKIYTEIWRKDKTKLKGDTTNLNDPFDIGIILDITVNKQGKIELNVSSFLITPHF